MLIQLNKQIIEPEWNVKSSEDSYVTITTMQIIEPEWNVKVVFFAFKTCVPRGQIIEPEWNVKSKV